MRGPDGAAALRKRETVMNNKLSTKGTWLTRLGNLIAGTQKHFPTGQLTIGGTAYDVATLVSTLQSLESAITSSDAAKAKWNDALKNEQATNANVAPLVRDYQSYLASSFGNAPSTLADFGLTPKKARTPLSVEKQATANAKRASTRTARHTMGKVQKLGVVGNVTSVVITPVTVPTPSVSQATPSATPPASSTTPTATPAASASGSTPH
jgi:hypothetical protein